AMSHKCALARLPVGGAKLVVVDRPDLDLEAAYRAIGDHVERMHGRFYTGPDVGTTSELLAQVAARTRYVTDPGPAGPGELAESTSEGVFRGIGATLRHLDGAEDWTRRVVTIQGLGEVGRGLARRLRSRGARVLASEVDPQRAEETAAELDL